MIKTGQELSDLTKDIRARLAVREHIVAPEPRFERIIKNTLIYMALSAGISYVILEYVGRF